MSDPFTPPYELEKPTLNPFDIVDFRRFLVENKVIVTAVSFTIAHHTTTLITSFFDNIVFSFFNKDENKDGEKDLSYLFESTFTFNGITFKLGSFLLSLVKFMLALILIFYISRGINYLIN